MTVLKRSRQRDAIRENLLHRTDHPTAEMIFLDIQRTFPSISLGTVYRNLSLLAGLGEARRLTFSAGPDRFDAVTDPHDHFVCRVCGAVLDMEDAEYPKPELPAAHPPAGVIECCDVTFRGVCCSCMKKNAS